MRSDNQLPLPSSHIRRIFERDATLLILRRQLGLDAYGAPRLYEIHNTKTARRNAVHREGGRGDLQSDTHAITIQISAITTTALEELDLRTIRAAGYKTTEEFREDWQRRYRGSMPDLKVYVHEFQMVNERYLDLRLHRNYTHDPDMAAEPTVDAATLARLAEMGTLRWKQEHARREAEAVLRTLHDRLRDLEAAYHRGHSHLEADLRVIRQRIQKIRRAAEERT